MKCINPTLTGHTFGDTLGRRFREAREHAGIKRPEAAEEIGLTSQHLGRIERDLVQMVNDPKTIARAARLYGVPQAWLYAGSTAGNKLVPDWYSKQPLTLAA